MAKRLFGAIPGIVEGDLFKTRLELSAGHVHAPTQAGISGSEKEGADSIVLSGGYEDDLDLGDEIIYTGHGGRDLITGKQTTNQPMTRGNLALALNAQNGLPVRVIRGPNRVSPHAPLSGYQYDGLYQVKDYWQGTGRSGYTVWRYRLVKIYPENINQNPSNLIQEVDGKSLYQTRRFEITTQRIIRDTALSRQVKALYNFHCQVCQIRLTTNSAPYAEGLIFGHWVDPMKAPTRSLIYSVSVPITTYSSILVVLLFRII